MLGANRTIDTYRLENSGDTTTYSGTKTLDGVQAYIEPASPELRTLIDAQQSLQTFVMYLDEGEDLIAGDKVVDSESNQYRVTSIEKYEENLDTGDLMTVYMNKVTEFYSD